MLFKVVDDWKQNLHPDDEVRLNAILKRVQQNRSAYRTAKDVKNAQLWCALLELDKKHDAIVQDFAKLEMIIEGFSDVIRRASGEQEEECECRHHCCCEEERSHRHSHKDSKLIESLEKF